MASQGGPEMETRYHDPWAMEVKGTAAMTPFTIPELRKLKLMAPEGLRRKLYRRLRQELEEHPDRTDELYHLSGRIALMEPPEYREMLQYCQSLEDVKTGEFTSHQPT
jgi:hypothetical protein